MVAMSILLIGLLAIVTQWPAGAQMVYQSRNQTQAAVMAEAVLEELAVTDFPSIDSGYRLDGPYQVFWIVTDGPIPDCKTVEVTVRWFWRNERYKIKMATIFSAES